MTLMLSLIVLIVTHIYIWCWRETFTLAAEITKISTNVLSTYVSTTRLL